jgi:xylulokinase
MSYLMGIDLGTSSVKTMIIDLEGRVLSVHIREYPIFTPQEGFAEQEPSSWWEATVGALRATIESATVLVSEICCIGFSGQMHGMVLLDRSGEVIRPAIIWCDQRSANQIDKIYQKIEVERFNRITLNSLSPGFQLASLFWVKQYEPQCYDRIAKVVLPKDYIRYRLTGNICTDVTDASSTLAFDTTGRRWSEEIIAELELSPEIFPECMQPTDLVGEVTVEAAKITGLSPGTPVVAGGSDQPMQAIGNGITVPGPVSLTIGTGGQFFSVCNTPIRNPNMNTHTFCNAVENTWYVLAATLNAGLALRWYRDKISCGADYDEISIEAARIVPGSEGLIFIPHLIGERTPHLNPCAKGMLYGLTLRHSRAHIARAVFEGVVFALRECLETLSELNIDADTILSSGGGAKNNFWLQIQADILERDIHHTESQEQACLGAAIVAGAGVGAFASIADGCRSAVRECPEVVRPVGVNVDVLRTQYKVFKQLYSRNKDLSCDQGTR